MTLIDSNVQKISTFGRPQTIFCDPQTNFSTFNQYISKSSKINLKSPEHSGIQTQCTIILRLSAYHLVIRCFYPLENLMKNEKVVRYKPETAGIAPTTEKSLKFAHHKSCQHHFKTHLHHTYNTNHVLVFCCLKFISLLETYLVFNGLFCVFIVILSKLHVLLNQWIL